MIFGLAACGMRGPLELPPGPAPTPLLDTPLSATPAAKTGAVDVSTDAKAKSQ